MPKPRIALPLALWPLSDQLAWEAAHRPGDQLDPPGRANGWKPNTRDTYERGYGHWLTWLSNVGLLDSGAVPAARCTMPVLRRYVGELRQSGLAPLTVRSRVHSLNCVLHAICAEADLAYIDAVERALARWATPVRNKVAKIVSPALLVATAGAAMAELHGTPGSRAARRYRDLMMVAFLALRPVRLANLAAITLDRHLERRGGQWWFRFEPAETKTGVALRFSLPQVLVPCFQHYLEVVRPLLLDGRPCRCLWVTGRGGGASEEAIYEGICATTARLVGHRINPHLFRDIVATFISEEAPEDRAMVADILGHTQLATSQLCYDHARSLRAQQRHVTIIDGIVGELPILEA